MRHSFSLAPSRESTRVMSWRSASEEMTVDVSEGKVMHSLSSWFEKSWLRRSDLKLAQLDSLWGFWVACARRPGELRWQKPHRQSAGATYASAWIISSQLQRSATF